MNLVILSLAVFASFASANKPEWTEPTYGEVERAAYDLLRIIGRESRGHLDPPVVILTGGHQCEPLATMLNNLTGAYDHVLNFRFSNNDGIFDMELGKFLAKNPNYGIVMLRGIPTRFTVGNLVADRKFKEHDLGKYAVVYQAADDEDFANGLKVKDLIRHAYGGLAKNCHYNVVPGMIMRAHLKFAADCAAALGGKAG